MIKENLLIIEDDEFRIQSLWAIWEYLGYDNVDVVGDEEAGISMMKEKTYDFVLASSRLIKDKPKFYVRLVELDRSLTQKVVFY